jgi:carboxypeptidase Q
MSKKTLVLALLFLLVSALLVAQQQVERIDLNVIHKIKTAELGGGGGFGGGGGGRGGARTAPVMETMYNLTDRYGPRLTNSPQFRAAGEWAVGQLKEWGLANVHLEKWATAPPPAAAGDNAAGGRGARAAIPSWEMTEYEGAMVSPTYMPIIGYPQAWCGSTDGKVTGDAIMVANPTTMADMDKLHGTLKGKIVLLGTGPLDLDFPEKPLGTRYTDAELTSMIPELIPTGGGGGRGGAGRGGRGGAGGPQLSQDEQRAVTARAATFWKDEGALLTISANGSTRGSGGVVPASNGSSRNGDPTKNLPSVSVTAENYNRVARLLEHSVPVKLSFNIQTKFDMSQTESFNVVAEIPGASKPGEIVMVGGHFDSWHMGTGATDNGAGSAVAMEVMRILKSANLKMDRTVRMALWGGEEEGLLGSSAYVKEHFADTATMKTTTEHDGFAGYFNIDNGTGKIRGIYLQGNEMVRPIFEQWFAAVKDLTPGVITIRNTGGTDHQSYDAVGLPGFQFIQDPMDYDSRTHHTNMDTYERIQQGDMEQMAIVEAFFVYQAATRPEKLPRKDLPEPRGNGNGRGRGGN